PTTNGFRDKPANSPSTLSEQQRPLGLLGDWLEQNPPGTPPGETAGAAAAERFQPVGFRSPGAQADRLGLLGDWLDLTLPSWSESDIRPGMASWPAPQGGRFGAPSLFGEPAMTLPYYPSGPIVEATPLPDRLDRPPFPPTLLADRRRE